MALNPVRLLLPSPHGASTSYPPASCFSDGLCSDLPLVGVWRVERMQQPSHSALARQRVAFSCTGRGMAGGPALCRRLHNGHACVFAILSVYAEGSHSISNASGSNASRIRIWRRRIRICWAGVHTDVPSASRQTAHWWLPSRFPPRPRVACGFTPAASSVWLGCGCGVRSDLVDTRVVSIFPT